MVIMRLPRVAATALVLGLCVSGCTGGSKPAAKARPKVAMLVSSSQTNNAKEMGAGFLAGAQSAGGVDASVTGPPLNDPPKQAEMLKQLAGDAPGGIAIQASKPELISAQFAAAARDGVPLIAIYVHPDGTAGVKTYIGGDNSELGRMLADELVRRLPAGAAGKIVVGSVKPGLSVMDQRAAGVSGELARKLPGLRMMGPFDTGIDPVANLAAWRRLITANPDALAFVGTAGPDSVSLAALHAETKGTWLAGSFDLDPKGMQGAKDGQLFALVSPEHSLKGSIAGWLEAVHASNGKPIPEGWIYTPGLLVTSTNIDKIIERQASDANKLAWFKPPIDKMTADLSRYVRPL